MLRVFMVQSGRRFQQSTTIKGMALDSCNKSNQVKAPLESWELNNSDGLANPQFNRISDAFEDRNEVDRPSIIFDQPRSAGRGLCRVLLMVSIGRLGGRRSAFRLILLRRIAH